MNKLTFALITLTLASGALAQTDEPASAPVGGSSSASTPAVVTRTTRAVERGASAVERGARRTGAAIERGAVKTGEAIRRGVEKTGHGIKRGGEKIEEKAKAASASS